MEINGKYGTAIVYNEYVEQEAISQIIGLLSHPASENAHVRIMSDVHSGAGCVIGFTARLTSKIIPNLIGVDIGCGVSSWKIGHEHEIGHKFDKLDAFIRKNVPSGKTVREFSPDRDMIASILKEFGVYEDAFYKSLKAVSKRTGQDYDYVHNSLGTLGGGNHFIEIDKDSDGFLWLTIHSGSRNFGLKIATHHQGVAKATIFEAFFEEEKAKIIGKYFGQKDKHHLIEQELKAVHSRAPKITSGLEYLEGTNADAYIEDMKVAQLFAQVNRRMMGRVIIEGFHKLNPKELEFVESVHNYINFEDGIVRKGAISAHAGEKVIIPLNMADGLIVGVGRGNEEWNCSAPHGAGRKMSRAKAKATIDLKDFQYVMQKAKVWSSCVGKDTLDESPQAYKKADEILEAITPTVDVAVRMFPVYNFKASE